LIDRFGIKDFKGRLDFMASPFGQFPSTCLVQKDHEFTKLS
jgi:hypothetical protein